MADSAPPPLPSARQIDWRQVATVGLVATLLIYWIAPHLPGWLVYALAAGFLLGLVIALRRFWGWLFGPVFFYDLVRTTRKGRHVLFRALYALALLAGLAIYYVYEFGARDLFVGSSFSSRDRNLERFATDFFILFVSAQQLAILLLAPVYAAAALVEENERGTLELLLASELSTREIVLGKLASRVANMGLLVLTGLPILALTELWGGVDPLLVLIGFGFSGLLILMLSGVSLLVSIRAGTSLEATFGAYFWFLLCAPCCVCLPLAPVIDSKITGSLGTEELLRMLGFYAAVSGSVLAWSVFWSIHSLNRLRLAERPQRPRLLAGVPEEIPEFPPDAAARDIVDSARPGPPPGPAHSPIGVYPMIWKELHSGPQFRLERNAPLATVLLILAVFVAAASLLAILLYSMQAPNVPHAITGVVRVVGTALACVLLFALAFYASGKITRERENATLQTLLLTPLSRAEILWAKWLGSLWSVRLFAWPLAAAWAAGTLFGGINLLALVLLLALGAVYAAFTAWLGLFCSTLSRTTVRASLWTIGTLLGLLAVPLVFRGSTFRFLSPIACLATLTFGYERLPEARDLEQVFGWGVAYALVTLVLWGATNHCFRR